MTCLQAHPMTWLSPIVYEQTILREGIRLGLSPTEIFSGRKFRIHVIMRGRAWRHLHNQGHSFAAIARAGGYDHTSVLSGIRRLAELERLEAAKRRPARQPRFRKFRNPWEHANAA